MVRNTTYYFFTQSEPVSPKQLGIHFFGNRKKSPTRKSWTDLVNLSCVIGRQMDWRSQCPRAVFFLSRCVWFYLSCFLSPVFYFNSDAQRVANNLNRNNSNKKIVCAPSWADAPAPTMTSSSCRQTGRWSSCLPSAATTPTGRSSPRWRTGHRQRWNQSFHWVSKQK